MRKNIILLIVLLTVVVSTHAQERKYSTYTIISQIKLITCKIKQEYPKIKLYLQSVLPITDIDLYTHFVDPTTGKMNTASTNDRLHLLGEGYLKWATVVNHYVNEK